MRAALQPAAEGAAGRVRRVGRAARAAADGRLVRVQPRAHTPEGQRGQPGARGGG